MQAMAMRLLYNRGKKRSHYSAVTVTKCSTRRTCQSSPPRHTYCLRNVCTGCENFPLGRPRSLNLFAIASTGTSFGVVMALRLGSAPASTKASATVQYCICNCNHNSGSMAVGVFRCHPSKSISDRWANRLKKVTLCTCRFGASHTQPNGGAPTRPRIRLSVVVVFFFWAPLVGCSF